MKSVNGFLSEDNNFFERECDARKHDAEMSIRAYCVTHNLDDEKLLHHVEALADVIVEYNNAIQEGTLPNILEGKPSSTHASSNGKHQDDAEEHDGSSTV